MPIKQDQGFTLVELITIVILLGIVSLYASSRFFGKSGFDAQLLEQEVLSSLRLTQLRSMNRNGFCGRWMVSNNQVMQISPTASVGSCSVSLPSDTSDSSYVNAQQSNVQLSLDADGNVDFIDFDGLGRPQQCATAECTVTLVGQSGTQRYICINSQGGIYAKTSNC
ncbi:pilus assembly FimT family protein [Vibrio pectenicida]|uniref:Type II secretion system protein n=1 Tax=Vibrio pectenicida TaxID=62763 RepID=A0A427U7P2_9VIBR|nr:type II secretion system protein [Vibrio pectenicida]RSD32664.1 type II secretion system protein [Vibrio pectenicida]